MIKYDRLWETMKSKGITKYQLINDYSISKALIHKLMYNKVVSMYTINKLCNILSCRIEDIATFEPDEDFKHIIKDKDKDKNNEK